jgi:hypothetical protein
VDHELPIHPDDIFKRCVRPKDLSFNTPKRLKLLKWLIKRGYKVPDDIVEQSQKAYDLKIFRWLLKNGYCPESFSEDFDEISMTSKNLSEEKLQWMMDHGTTRIRVTRVDKIQVALFLANHGMGLAMEGSDPRLREFMSKRDHLK